jgi:glycosyltransferase involved in cell wall biosynthesis
VGGPRHGLLERLQRATSPALWQRIEIREGLAAAEVADEMARATLLLFPTRVDTSPNAVKEAVVAGLPVVASAVGGIVDYVLPGRNGITFEAGNPAAFLGAIREALAHPFLGRGEVEATALREMRDYLSPARMSAGFLQAYRQVLGRE